MKQPVFEGVATALVTPFQSSTVDYPKLEQLLDFQLASGVDAIVVCGTTGEAATMTPQEQLGVIAHCIRYVAGRCKVIAGTGSNDTNYAVKLSNEAEKAGVDAILSVTPYYNKTSQRGLIQHYNFIADRVSVPIITYNVPSRTGVNIKPETYYELSRHKRIVGAKESNADISALAQTIALCGDDLAMYSGNDDQITAFMALGGKGVISVLSNILPEVSHNIASKYLEGDYAESRRLQLEYLDLCNDLFLDVNPIPVKEAMNMMGMKVGDCRLPLYKMTDAARETLRKTLARHGLV